MPSIKDLKKRIGSTKNTQQTTKAMKMVSAAKLRRAQEAIVAQRPYARRLSELLTEILKTPGLELASPLVQREGATGPGKILLVVVTSDRGLCGAFNSSIIKSAQRAVTQFQSEGKIVTLAYAGKRGYEFFKTKAYSQGPYFQEAGGKVTFAKAKGVSLDLEGRYLSGEFDRVAIIYNEFKNAISQKVVLETLLPIAIKADGADAVAEVPSDVLVKPSAKVVAESLLDRHLAIQVFRVLLESQAGEHGARMSAMENATKNAGEMIKKLTLQYNKQRQAGITKELLEIISGAESQKNS